MSWKSILGRVEEGNRHWLPRAASAAAHFLIEACCQLQGVSRPWATVNPTASGKGPRLMFMFPGSTWRSMFDIPNCPRKAEEPGQMQGPKGSLGNIVRVNILVSACGGLGLS